MSMGYGANFADVIKPEALGVVVGDKKLVDGFVKKFNGYELGDCESSEELAETLNGDDPMDIDTDRAAYKNLKKKWEKISSKFKEVTGLELFVEYHDSENEGSCYDDVDGVYFCVGGLWQPTKKYREFKKKFGNEAITRAFYVTFG